MRQRQIPIFQALDVAHHLGFRLIAVENGVSQVITLAVEVFRCRNSGWFLCSQGDGILLKINGKNARNLLHILPRGGLVQADLHPGIGIVEIQLGLQGSSANCMAPSVICLDGDGIKEVL